MLILAGKKLKSLADESVSKPEEIHTLDCTMNNLRNGSDFKPFKNLNQLVIDKNNFNILDDFPKIPSLETFSANKNHFANLSYFLE
mmetsp:Transcript_20715/g.18123  ORF Transcript_20715/g.18123 Transcript_20715/m.18123 type:complete len:86 (-) Transcript_20715:542-799(-)